VHDLGVVGIPPAESGLIQEQETLGISRGFGQDEDDANTAPAILRLPQR
jgi:hypothetical protein